MYNILKIARKWWPRKYVLTPALKTIIHAQFELGTYATSDGKEIFSTPRLSA
jgi:hypothetical protein